MSGVVQGSDPEKDKLEKEAAKATIRGTKIAYIALIISLFSLLVAIIALSND